MLFIRKHPNLSSFLIAIGIAIGVDILGFLAMLFGVLVSSNCQPNSTESCDGESLMIYAVTMFSIPAAIAVGGVIAAVIYPVMRTRLEQDV